MKKLLLVVICTVVMMVFPGCQCSGKHAIHDEGWNKADRIAAKEMLPVTTAANDEEPDISSEHIADVPLSLAIAKGLQAMENYDHADAAALGYDFPLGSVFEPWRYTPQTVDEHSYWVAMLDFKAGNQAAYNQCNRTSLGIMVIDREDVRKPGKILLRDNNGDPYLFKIHFRDANYDQYSAERYLRYHGFERSVNLGKGRRVYLDDITPELEDGTWKMWLTATYNRCQFRVTGSSWKMPKPEKVILLDPTSLDEKVNLVSYDDVAEVPGWVDRIYSERVATEWIEAWGYNPENYNLNSDKGRIVLDQNQLDVVVSRDGKSLNFVGVMTSNQSDNSATGIIVLSTRTLVGKYFPLNGDRALATRFHATQVINNVNEYRGWKVEELTIQWLFGWFVWEGSYTTPVSFPTQSRGANDNSGRATSGSTYMGCVLLKATADLNCADVVFAESKQEAFDRYEDKVFRQTHVTVGSTALKEYKADGHLKNLQMFSDKGQSCLVFELKEEKYAGYLFRLTIDSFFDRDTIDALGAQNGDRVTFRYGDTKTSPMCNVKSFKDIDRPGLQTR